MPTINGEPAPQAAGQSVLAVVGEVTGHPLDPSGSRLDGGKLGVAVARNSAVLPRSQWARTTVQGQDQLDILTAVQGG